MTTQCVRCELEKPAIVTTPYPGELGDEIRSKICADCWSEWQRAEIMAINELRLNFMDPKANEILVQHMREFLVLDPPAPTGE